jgi:hypothetical protein
MPKSHKIIFCLIFITSLKTFGQLQNKVFKEYIKTAIVSKNLPKEIIVENQLIDFNDQGKFFLSFDDLSLKYSSYYLRIIHCQSDWKPSQLSDIEYLSDFNDVPIRDNQNSMGTKIPYLHYQIPLPKVRITGNFIAQVYLNRNKKDSIITKRFSVYQTELAISAKINFARRNEFRLSHQALELSLSYPDHLLLSDDDHLKIVLHKNSQDQNYLNRLPKPQINGFERKFNYVFFDNENIIPGGNEYRMIDMRSTQQKLNFVAHIQALENYSIITTYPETAQGNYTYSEKMDMNAGMVIENYENPENNLLADYVYCQFIFKSRKFEDEKIYLSIGNHSFHKAEDSSMDYDEKSESYQKKILLKQGIYNYQYLSNNLLNHSLEGNYSQTENQYDLLVYFRKPGDRFDSIIGYKRINYPNR